MSIQILRSIMAWLLTIALSSCGGLIVRDNEVAQEIQGALETTTADGVDEDEPPAEVSAALLPSVEVQLPGIDPDADVEQRFDVKVRRIVARDFFLGLVESTPYNIVLEPSVSGYISLDMKNVTVPEVLETVRSVNGYDYDIHGRNIHIFPNTVHTRIFMVDYLAMQRAGRSLIYSKTGRLTTSSGGGSSPDGDAAGGNLIGGNSSAISTTTNTDFWRSLRESLEVLVSHSADNMVTVNPPTGMVMVRAAPADLRMVERFLRDSQSIAQRQVIIEARIIEVMLSDGFQSGVNWASISENSKGETVTVGQIGGGQIFGGSGLSGITSASGDLNPNNPTNINGTTTSAFGGVFTLALSGGDFNAFIELLKTQGDVQVLSSPRVSTVNNQKAVLKVGSDEFFVTSIDTENNSGTDTSTVSVELDTFFSGVSLDVTPQISHSGDIVLHIHPAVSDVSQQTKNVTTTGGNLSLPLAVSNIRESDTVINAANGQVVVIGGLMQNVAHDDEASVPFLGDIPVIGNLFRHTKKSTRKSELVILLKPTVIDAGNEVWQRELQRSSRSIRNMPDM